MKTANCMLYMPPPQRRIFSDKGSKGGSVSQLLETKE